MKKSLVNLAIFLVLAICISTIIAYNRISYENVTVTSDINNTDNLEKETENIIDNELLIDEEPNKIPEHGELIDWQEVQNLIPNGSTIVVTDLDTRQSFNIKRTFGTNHLDGEALTLDDSNIIKNIWGGFSWTRRPVIVSINDKHIAASMSAMPHAGVDSAPAVAIVKNRSDGYGAGENLDAVKDNGMNGVIDIHFFNSKRHMDNKPDPMHKEAILKAAGK